MLNISIIGTEWDSKTGQIFSATWEAFLPETDVKKIGRHVFCAKDPKDPDFVPLSKITESVVLGWLKNDLDFDQIEKQMTTVSPAHQVPW